MQYFRLNDQRWNDCDTGHLPRVVRDASKCKKGRGQCATVFFSWNHMWRAGELGGGKSIAVSPPGTLSCNFGISMWRDR